RPFRSEGVPVTVVDEPNEVRRPDHVEVQVELVLLDVAFAQLRDVIVRTDQAVLFAAPECETHLVAWLVLRLRHLDGSFEDGRASARVVVDSGAFGNRVEVSPDDDGVL